jgi:hypothetical protein
LRKQAHATSIEANERERRGERIPAFSQGYQKEGVQSRIFKGGGGLEAISLKIKVDGSFADESGST